MNEGQYANKPMSSSTYYNVKCYTMKVGGCSPYCAVPVGFAYRYYHYRGNVRFANRCRPMFFRFRRFSIRVDLCLHYFRFLRKRSRLITSSVCVCVCVSVLLSTFYSLDVFHEIWYEFYAISSRPNSHFF